MGDGLLIEAANRLSALQAKPSHIARVAGDEFVLLVRGGREHAIDTALEVQPQLAAPCSVESLPVQLGASIGITVYPDDGARPRLMANATLAMRNVKLGGGGSHACYHPSMSVDLRDQADLLADLRHAVARQELTLYFQPKIDAKSLQITAAEALLRWQHPQRGLIGPSVFVPLAERHGLIESIGLWAIEDACRQAAQWREAGLRMRIAVNTSGHPLRRDELVRLGCDELQGYFFAKPMTATMLALWADGDEATRRRRSRCSATPYSPTLHPRALEPLKQRAPRQRGSGSDFLPIWADFEMERAGVLWCDDP